MIGHSLDTALKVVRRDQTATGAENKLRLIFLGWAFLSW